MEKVQDSSSTGANGFHKHQSQHHPHQEQEEYEREQHQQLRQAQRCLLQRKYDETISICSNYFQSFKKHNQNKFLEHGQTLDTEESSDVMNNVMMIKLKCQIRRPYIDVDQFDIHVSCCDGDEPTEPTILDQMIVIALQAFEEKDIIQIIQMKESSSSILWNRKRPSTQLWNLMIETLSKSLIGLEAFCVWMEFWQAKGLWREALQWNVSVLCRYSKGASSFLHADPTRSIMSQKTPSVPSSQSISPQEELWIECLVKQLPRIQDPKLAVELLDQLTKLLLWNGHQVQDTEDLSSPTLMDWDKMEEGFNKCLLAVRMGDHPQPDTIRSMQDSWVHGNFGATQEDDATANSTTISSATDGLLSPTAVKTILDAWEEATTGTIHPCDQAGHTGDSNGHETEDTSMVPIQNTSSLMPYHPQQNPKSATWIDGIVNFVHRKVQETIRQVILAQNNPHFKSQVLLSLTITILSWRQRKNLKVVLSYILLPIRELLDALKAQ